MNPGSYDEISARRYARVESNPDSFSLRLAPRIQRIFESEPRRSGADLPAMLDLGCGTGQLTDFFRRAGFFTVGVDSSIAMLRHQVTECSERTGAVALADAAQLPLVAGFDLITATFNVLNHLPDTTAVVSLLAEVGRLLAPAGLFVFDINTVSGLGQTAELTEIQAGADERTVWTRHWEHERLVLEASGTFFDDGSWYSYSERIEKLVLPTGDIVNWCVAAGLERPNWRSDDLLTALDNPEQNATAFGVVQSSAVS